MMTTPLAAETLPMNTPEERPTTTHAQRRRQQLTPLRIDRATHNILRSTQVTHARIQLTRGLRSLITQRELLPKQHRLHLINRILVILITMLWR